MTMKRIIPICLSLALCICCSCDKNQNKDIDPETPAKEDAYKISDGKISQEVLRNYLSRAITEAEYLNSAGLNTDGYYGTTDDTRMLLNVGAKFVGRALYTWNGEQKFNNSIWLDNAKKKIGIIHAQDPDVIFQAALFETVSKSGVETVSIPAWVFEAFGKPVENRTFRYADIMDEGGKYKDQWGAGTCVPDMSREEAQMWFYYMAVRYMEAGIEALHMGQINLMCSMGDQAANYAGWRKMQGLIREAAKTKARRGIILMDAHCDGIVVDGKHLFDFASYPLRLTEIPTSNSLGAELKKDHLDSILGKTKGGMTPSGWTTDRLPYILEFDNFGTSDHPGKANINDIFVWGYDEISWLGMLAESDAQAFLKACVEYMAQNDPVGYIQMPGCRVAAFTGANGASPYRCNTKSSSCPTGRNLENTIKELWK